VGFRRTRGIQRAPFLAITNLGRKAPPLPPTRASPRVQARANSPAATALIDETRLSMEGLDAAKEGIEPALLQDHQAHKKTRFRPTTTNTPVPPTRASARIQARAVAVAADGAVDKSRLSNEEGLDAAKEASEPAFLWQKKCRHVKTKF